jgi:hypothetical protein
METTRLTLAKIRKKMTKVATRKTNNLMEVLRKLVDFSSMIYKEWRMN